jgi:hypothetical protein
MAAVSTVAVAAITGGSNSVTVPESTRMGIYGYGGDAVIEQRGSVTANAVTGTVQPASLETAESEPNDRQSTADKVSVGSVVTAELTAAEVDWYAFEAAKDQSVVVELDRSKSEGVTALILYDADGEYLDLRYVATIASTYFTQVVDIESGDGAYTLTVKDETDLTPTPTTTPEPTPTPVPDPQQPYYGTVRSIPGRIEAEDFDEGGQDVAYNDTGADNTGGEYRSEGVDVERSSDTEGGYSVGWVRDGEWLEYTLDITPGTYDVHFRVATPYDGRQIKATLGGESLGTVDVPNTRDWYNWMTVTLSNVEVTTKSEAVLRLELNGGSFNLNWVEFEATTVTATPTPEPTVTPTRTPEPTPTVTPTPTPLPDMSIGTQGYGEFGYGGISR